jgi:hypothetical protein
MSPAFRALPRADALAQLDCPVDIVAITITPFSILSE